MGTLLTAQVWVILISSHSCRRHINDARFLRAIQFSILNYHGRLAAISFSVVICSTRV
jgi:hypothetical protein